jgi:HTH-type transcriptional regulator / antitoxin HigA
MISTALKTINKTWPAVAEYLSVPHNEESYNRLVEFMDSLIDEIGNDANHPKASLIETVGVLIAEYEEEHYPIHNSKGLEVLKYLMAEHGIKQSDLREIGSQGIVSEILNGKRELNIRQIKLLSERFNVSPAVFIQ